VETAREALPVKGSIVRLGIVGLGHAARTLHAPAIARVPELRVAACCDVDGEALSSFLPGAQLARYSDWRSLLDAEVDAVAVITPPLSLAEIGSAVLQTGKHLFVDKPLAANRAGHEALLAAAQQSPGVALLGLNFRFHALVRRAREMVKAGALGEVRAIRSLYTHCTDQAPPRAWLRQRAVGGGVLVNEGIHHFDLWRYLLDCEIEHLSVHTVSLPDCDDDTSTVSARLSGGILGSALFSLSTGPECELEILGTDGRLRLSPYRFDGLCFTARGIWAGHWRQRLRETVATLRGIPAAASGRVRGGDFFSSYVSMWSHFARCVRGLESPSVTLRDGHLAMAALFEALAPSA
jgi:myo-inositol 2-dehydrogenase/D-chiro-inositol 1-dehydrogenase/scyllo-inositol 2-dehydrogenase (NAD+)